MNLEYRQKITINFAAVLKSLLELKEEFDQLNRYLSIATFLKTMINGITISASVFLILEQHILPKMDNILWTVSVNNIIMILLDITLSCWSSQIIINEINGLIESVEKRITIDLIKNRMKRRPLNPIGIIEKKNNDLKLIDDIEYLGLNRLNAMKKSFRFNVLDMFSLNHTTILHFMGSVVSYSILLVQTK